MGQLSVTLPNTTSTSLEVRLSDHNLAKGITDYRITMKVTTVIDTVKKVVSERVVSENEPLQTFDGLSPYTAYRVEAQEMFQQTKGNLARIDGTTEQAGMIFPFFGYCLAFTSL